MYYNTVTPLLLSSLKKIMADKAFADFRLVGGTSLSLQRGHRMSDDIDLFSDLDYGTLDFGAIESFLKSTFPYFETSAQGLIGMGTSYFVGTNKDELVKLDIYQSDKYIRPATVVDGIQMASVEEIIAMKIDVVSRGGRKKDFWDLHELLPDYSINSMLALHEERYPYAHNRKEIFGKLIAFGPADDDLDPKCLRGKYWEVIKLDFLDAVKKPNSLT
jgi:hypothetical protein